MKKKIVRKLTLHKRTVANLDKNQIVGVLGGATEPTICGTCVTDCFTVCVTNCPECLPTQDTQFGCVKTADCDTANCYTVYDPTCVPC